MQAQQQRIFGAAIGRHGAVIDAIEEQVEELLVDLTFDILDRLLWVADEDLILGHTYGTGQMRTQRAGCH
jgi:hypothetical protein